MATSASLNSFYVYNPLFGPDEDNQEEKILFYHPDEEKLGNKVKNIGLCEALVNFTHTFSPHRVCEFLHTVKRKQAFYQPESNYFMILTVNNPSIQKKTKEGKQVTKYKEDDVDDILLQSVVKQAYSMFRLFHGSLHQITSEHGIEHLRKLLNTFYTKYLTTLNFEEMDIFTSIEGIQFLPVEKHVYLKIMCFINLTSNTFPQIRETVFMYKDHLVWSGLEQEDIRVLYKFICQFLSSNGNQSDLIIPLNRATSNGFLTGPSSLEGKVVPEIPKIYIGEDFSAVYLVIFRRGDITCIFLFDEPMPVDIDMYRALSQFIGPQLDHITPALIDNYSRKQTGEDTYRFIYFNHMNLALKSPIRNKMSTLTKETIQVINQMHSDFKRSKDNTNEQIINTGANRWVVGKLSENRELYIIFDDKKTNLIEVNEELRKLYGSLFGSIFLVN